MKKWTVLVIFCTIVINVEARILPVGVGYTYNRISDAAMVAIPGDTIVVYDAVIYGGMSISNLKGNANNWITIMPPKGKSTTITGGSNSIQFSDAAYLKIHGFIIEKQTGNGMNIDDAGTFDTPTHHIQIHNCTFRNINATGNNDLLKLSGLEDFEITECTFLNGSAGGSGIDMVGCHRGVIANNSFENLGSNSIQAKGGTTEIDILRNFFKNGGARALNLGGSTGLAYFRPQNATSEASKINVIANVIEGSEAAIAFVGSRQIYVTNNTILRPTKWVFRILQETVDVNRFLPCGEVTITNNLIVIDKNVNVTCNIGPNTAPETFLFTHNMWFKQNIPNWSGPDLPGVTLIQLINDPLILAGSQYRIPSNSPAVGAGLVIIRPTLDIENKNFNANPSIGAYEANPLVEVKELLRTYNVSYNNPVDSDLYLHFDSADQRSIQLISITGQLMSNVISEDKELKINMSHYKPGIYLLQIIQGEHVWIRKVVKA